MNTTTQQISARRHVVLGGLGFLGHELVRSLNGTRTPTVIVDRVDRFRRATEDTNSPDVVRIEVGSLSDPIFRTLFECGDVVFDLWNYGGPLLPPGGISNHAESTVFGAIKMIESAVSAGVNRIVFASSGGAVYGVTPFIAVSETARAEPISHYGLAKLGVEHYLELFKNVTGANYLILRLANVYGPSNRFGPSRNVVANILRCLLEGTPFIVWGDGNVTRDYVFLEDAIQAFRLASESTLERGIFNIGTGVGTTISGLADLCSEITGRILDIRYERARGCDVPFSVLDCRKAEKYLGWTPRVPLNKGIAATWDHAQKQYRAMAL